MLAVKAIYENGAIKFDKIPPYRGSFEILIIFPDDIEIEKRLYFHGTKEMDKIMDAELTWKPKRFLER